MKPYLERKPAMRCAAAGAVLALGAVASAAFAGSVPTSIDFLPAVQTPAANLRVSIVNLSVPGSSGFPPDPCHLTVQYINADGVPAGEPQSLTIASGHSAFALSPRTSSDPVALRAHVVIHPPPNPESCAALYAGFEVYDPQTLKTNFVSPFAIRGFSPQPPR